jgi:predicted nucleic acid-binding protein
MNGLLFDASSLLKAFKENRLDLLRRSYIQRLTIYEALNALWKETYLLRIISFEKSIELADILINIVRHMYALDPVGLEKEIFNIALNIGITIYDASYVALARKHNLVLVTEDRRLRNKCKNLVNVKSLDEIISETSM